MRITFESIGGVRGAGRFTGRADSSPRLRINTKLLGIIRMCDLNEFVND